MRIPSQAYKLAFIALSVVAVTGCKRENGIDNDTVIKKPYSLYFGDNSGALQHTNTGDTSRLIFASDGFPIRALETSGENIVFVKRNVHLSQDNGKNFNPTDSSVNAFYLSLDAQLGKPYTPWPSIILDVPEHGKLYLSSVKGKGIIFSEDHGVTWKVDDNWDQFLNPSFHTSIARLSNGKVFIHNYSSDSLYVRDNGGDSWSYVHINTMLPKGSWFLSSFNNALVATDITGANGVWFSVNEGKDWSQYSGLPTGILYSTAAPFNSTLLVGTDGKGIYRLQGSQFVPSNNGLDDNTTVYSIAAKEQIFKNEISRKFIYLATSTGVYRSEDNGHNWSKSFEGHFVQLNN